MYRFTLSRYQYIVPSRICCGITQPPANPLLEMIPQVLARTTHPAQNPLSFIIDEPIGIWALWRAAASAGWIRRQFVQAGGPADICRVAEMT